MARTRKREKTPMTPMPNTGSEEIPPGGTRKAFDREPMGGGRGTPLDDQRRFGVKLRVISRT